MKNFNKQLEWIDKGRQIGYHLINDGLLVECAVQKRNQFLLLYYVEWDMKLDFDEYAKEKYLVFKDVSFVISFIESKNLSFDKFVPQKGCKIFNPNDYNFDI